MTELDRAPSVDALVRSARAANIRRDVAVDHVRELDLDRWAARDRAARAAAGVDIGARLRWLVAGFALASAAAAVLWLALAPAPVRESSAALPVPPIAGATAAAHPAPPPIAARPLAIGDRVALVAAPGAAYRVISATAATTAVAVDDGTITARVWPGPPSHPLTITGGGLRVVASDAVFELAVIDGRASVVVMRGAVDAGAVDGPPRHLTAGERVPAGSPEPADRSAVDSLLAVASPPPARAVTRPSPPVTLPAPMPPPTGPSITIKDRWRAARLLRGQGKLAEAVAACLAIADANDATWSPIALVEAIEIDAGPLADPEHAVELADRFLRTWPAIAAARDVRALRCKSLAQLGRAGECAAQRQ